MVCLSSKNWWSAVDRIWVLRIFDKTKCLSKIRVLKKFLDESSRVKSFLASIVDFRNDEDF